MARLLQSQEGRATLLLKEGATCLDSCDEPNNFVTIAEQVKATYLMEVLASTWVSGRVDQQRLHRKPFLTPTGLFLP
jgi:hypothetical protein